MLCFSYIAYPLPVIVREICLFDNFEKLSMLLRLSRDMLEGWARSCSVHVFLASIVWVLLNLVIYKFPFRNSDFVSYLTFEVFIGSSDIRIVGFLGSVSPLISGLHQSPNILGDTWIRPPSNFKSLNRCMLIKYFIKQ